jgi:Tfp pilus assembly protein PilX
MHGAMSKIGNTQPRGSALIVALALVALLASISSVLMTEMTTRAKHVEVDLEDIKAFEAAEAGIDAALNDINSAPVYQPYMSGPAVIINGVSQPSGTATRQGNGMLDSSGNLMSGNTSGVPLVGLTSGKPLTVHVAKKADGVKPGSLGTSSWVAPTYTSGHVRTNSGDDIDGNDRPTWRALQMLDVNRAGMTFGNGRPRYCEDHIQPQALGNVAFFTYAIDWFHDGIDNDGDGIADDRNERNKYTIYSTGIHRGISQSGVTETGKVVTIEVNVQALDRDYLQVPNGPLEIPIKPRAP